MERKGTEFTEWTKTADAESGMQIGFGIALGGDDRSAIYPFKYTRHITGWGCARMFAGRLLGKMRREACIISISITDHEVRFGSKIVSKERPQRVMNRNRIVRATKLGADIMNARLRTCDAASSADNTLEHERGEAVARNSQILTQMGSAERLISTGVLRRGMCRVSRRPVDLPCAATVRLPRGGGKYRPV